MISRMSLVKSRKNLAARLLVLLLLLSAQSFSMAHELTHVSFGDYGVLCEVCSAGHALDAGVKVEHSVSLGHFNSSFQVVEPLAVNYPAVTYLYTARAPPLQDMF